MLDLCIFLLHPWKKPPFYSSSNSSCSSPFAALPACRIRHHKHVVSCSQVIACQPPLRLPSLITLSMLIRPLSHRRVQEPPQGLVPPDDYVPVFAFAWRLVSKIKFSWIWGFIKINQRISKNQGSKIALWINRDKITCLHNWHENFTWKNNYFSLSQPTDLTFTIITNNLILEIPSQKNQRTNLRKYPCFSIGND